MSGEEILYNISSKESELEDLVKLGIAENSNGEIKFIKFYYTDGFGWYFNNNKIVFVLHECKIGQAVGKTMRGYKTCLRKALLQNIGYYFCIKHKKYTKFSKKLNDIANSFGYSDINKFIIDHFGMFLITSDQFCANIIVNNDIQNLLNTLEPEILNTNKSPSKYWEDDRLKNIMSKFDIDNIPMQLISNWDSEDTVNVIKSLINK